VFQLVRVTKPTGRGVCPPNVTRAQEIDRLINERAGTRELSDSEFAEVEGGDDHSRAISISSDDDEPAPVPGPVKARIVRTTDTSSHRSKPTRANRGLEIMDRLTDALDPAHQHARDDNRAQRGFEQAHFLALTQQLRDSQTTVESLRSTISILRGRIQAGEISRQQAEMRLEMLEMSVGTRPFIRRVPQQIMPSAPRDRKKPRTKTRCEEWHPDGGGRVMWLTDTEMEISDTENSPKDTKPPGILTDPLSPLSTSTLPSPLSAFKRGGAEAPTAEPAKEADKN
jgi:hypothetical protein